MRTVVIQNDYSAGPEQLFRRLDVGVNNLVEMTAIDVNKSEGCYERS
jgi:hypothetical protein